jgi:hypothetical protein
MICFDPIPMHAMIWILDVSVSGLCLASLSQLLPCDVRP